MLSLGSMDRVFNVRKEEWNLVKRLIAPLHLEIYNLFNKKIKMINKLFIKNKTANHPKNKVKISLKMKKVYMIMNKTNY